MPKIRPRETKRALKRNYSVELHSKRLDNLISKQDNIMHRNVSSKILRKEAQFYHKENTRLVLPIKDKSEIVRNILNSKSNLRRYIVHHYSNLPEITPHKADADIPCKRLSKANRIMHAYGKSLNIRNVESTVERHTMKCVVDESPKVASRVDSGNGIFSEYTDLNEKYYKNKRLGRKVERVIDALLSRQNAPKQLWEHIADYKMS